MYPHLQILLFTFLLKCTRVYLHDGCAKKEKKYLYLIQKTIVEYYKKQKMKELSYQSYPRDTIVE